MNRRFSLLLTLASLLVGLPAAALPRMTLMTNSRCSNCHVNPQGSGMRENFGWYTMATTGQVTWDKLGLKSLHDMESNELLGGMLTVGGDLRLQVAKSGQPSAELPSGPGRLLIPMQWAPGVKLKLGEQLSLAASVNLAGVYAEKALLEDINGAKFYPGHTNFDGWLRFKANDDMPSIRVGMLQPSFGIRHDDHTIMIRGNAADLKKPLIPAFYNDPGAEVTYESFHWLTIDAGAFLARNFNAARFSKKDFDPGMEGEKAMNTPLFSGRITLWPQWLDEGINMWVGGSVLKTNGFLMEGGHLGIGKTYLGTLIAEVSHSEDSLARSDFANRKTLNYMLQLAYPFQDWLTFEARVERATTDADGKTSNAKAAVLGVQYFPVPMLELRPEYRYLDTDLYTIGQWTLQVHAFF